MELRDSVWWPYYTWTTAYRWILPHSLMEKLGLNLFELVVEHFPSCMLLVDLLKLQAQNCAKGTSCWRSRCWRIRRCRAELCWHVTASDVRQFSSFIDRYFVVIIWGGFPSMRILGDPGASSRDEAIFSGESLLQELKSPWELILTEPVPEVVEFRPADWAEKYFSAQSARSSSRVTL